MKGRQFFVCRRNFAKFVDIETVILEKDFDQDPEKDTTSPAGLLRPGSMDYDPGRLSGRISFKKLHTLFVKTACWFESSSRCKFYFKDFLLCRLKLINFHVLYLETNNSHAQNAIQEAINCCLFDFWGLQTI